MKNTPNPLRVLAILAASLLCAYHAHAQNIWVGISGVSATTNWSDALNWSSGTTPAGEGVLFQDNGAVAVVGVVNNVVDGAFAGSAGSLQYANTNNSHTTLIADGVTLSLAGALIAGTETASDISGKTNTLTGLGGALVANSPGANFIVRQWPAAATSIASRTTLDMSGLGTFTGAFDRMLIGVANSGGANRATGRLILASTNTITLGGGTNPQLDVGDSSSNNGQGSQLSLGQTNALYVNTITVGRYKETGVTMNFRGGLSSPTLYLRGSDGSSRVTLWNIGDMGTGSGTATVRGTVDLTGGILNGQVDTLVVGRASEYTGSSSVSGPGTGFFTFNAGTLDVNTLRIGYQGRGTGNAATTAGVGTVNVNGTAQVVVNTALELGRSSGGTGVAATTGTLNVNGGTVVTPGIAANFGGTANSVAISGNGMLVVSNTAGPGINGFAMTNGALKVPALTAAAAVTVTNLTTGAGANSISILSIPAVTAYPAQFTIIKYSSGISGAGFNFTLGTLPPSIGDPYAGYISNNTANSSVDLVLTGGLAPAKTITWNGTPTGNWEAGSGTVANWLLGSTPTNFSQTDFVTFDDSASGVTTVNLTTTLLPTAVTVNNSTKSYTFNGSGHLSGGTGLTKAGSGTLTVANDVANDFSGPIAINGGTLSYNQPDGTTIPNVISGAGTFSQAGSGGLTLSGANTLTGPITVMQGTLIVGNNSALGTTNGSTTIASGATLDINGPTGNTRRLGAEPIVVGGAGVSGSGAIVNNSGNDTYPAVSFVTLTANTTFGGSGRWDLRATGSGLADPATAALSTSGQPYNLTKVGLNEVAIANATIDPALADIDIQQGTFQINGNNTGLGNPAKTLTVEAGTTFSVYDTTNLLNKKVVLADTATFENTHGANTVIGPITLNGVGTFNVAGVSLTLNGTLGGAGVLYKIGQLPLSLNGNGSGLTGGVNINVGTLVVNNTLGCGVTNQSTGTLMGSGPINGTLDALGAVMPGASNVVGTLTAGSVILEAGSTLYYDLGYDTTPGSGSNDLIVVNGDLTVNGNMIVINPLSLLRVGVPYRLFNYTGNLIWNADLFFTDAIGYTYTVNTNTAGQVNLVASGGPPMWTGGSAATSNWSDSANWGGTAIAPGNSLVFAGSVRLNNFNDTTPDTPYNSLAFAAGAGAFTLNGNSINLGGSIVNYSVNPQTVNADLSLAAANAFSGTSGTLVIGGDVQNTVNLATLTLGGTGILSNRLANASATTNTLVLNDTNANWTLRDNPASTAVTNPVALDIQAGTFNFGQGASAPVLASTAAINARLGVIGGAPATFNMVDGTLIIPVRFNTGAAGNTIATLNQSGGLISVEDVFQGSDSSATAVTAINVSGGTLSVGEAEASPNTFFLCSRGTSTLTLSSSGLVRCGTFDVSRNASGAGSVGVVNLNGGTLNATRVSTGTSSFGAGGTPTATFNFNGGTLKARASSTTYFQGRAEIPITSVVKSGGAVIDSDTNAISVLEPLQHDGTLGGTPDGGLIKLGSGTLTLTAANTFTGPTLVNNGTLLVSGSLAATPVTVASGGRLGGTGSMGGTATVNAGGTVAPGTATAIGTLTVANAVLHGSTFIKLSKSATPATNDVLAATAISLGGTLDATNAGPMLISGDSFTVFSGALSGSILPGTLPPLWPGLTWNTSQLNSAGRISVTGTMIPPQIMGGVSGTNFVLTGSGGVVGATYHVLTSTSVAAPLPSWTPAATGVFDSSGNLNISLGVNPSVPVLFYRVTVP